MDRLIYKSFDEIFTVIKKKKYVITKNSLRCSSILITDIFYIYLFCFLIELYTYLTLIFIRFYLISLFHISRIQSKNKII